MGGKQKQAQRTKGNVKPSSSGRSATLLGNVSSAGFSVLKEGSNPFPTFPTFHLSDDLDPNIDPNFYLVLKKMNKKDSTTRLKAIQEYAKLVEDSDMETMRGVLPFWPRLYNILAGDVDHRVREAAHRAQGITVVHTKKLMAPYLRQVAGSWFTGQFDTYHPSANAASCALKDAFPPNKFVEAIVFCQEEIVKFLSDTLLEQIPQLASNSGEDSDGEEKQIRLVVSSLQGYAHLLRILPQESLSNATVLQNSKAVLDSKHFWKLKNDNIPMIRSSLFLVVTAVLEKAPLLLAEQHKQVVKAVVEKLNEVDVVVLPQVWEALLQILVTFDDWEEYCNVEENIIPQLLRVIYEGAYRCSSVVFPMVLPLLSSFVQKVSDKKKFANSIFTTFREGIGKKAMGASCFNNEATARCYIECICYVAANGILDSGLVEEHILSVLELTSANVRLPVLYQAFADEISSLLHFWINNDGDSCHRELYQCFWGYLPRVISKGLAKFPDIDTRMKELILIQHVDLCSSLRDPFQNRGKKKPLQVRFHMDVENDEEEKDKKKEEIENLVKEGGRGQKVKSPLCEKLSKNLTEFIQKLCEMYFEEIKEKHDLCYVYPVAELLLLFDSKSVFDSLRSNWELVDLLIDIHNKFIEVSKDSERYISFFVIVVACLSEHMSSEDRELTLKTMCQNPDTFRWLLHTAGRSDCPQTLLYWLRNENLTDILMTLTQYLCVTSKRVLTACATTAFDGGLVVNTHSISSVLLKLCTASDDEEAISCVAEILSALSYSVSKMAIQNVEFKEEVLANSVEKAVIILFQHHSPLSISPNLKDGWLNGLQILVSIGITDIKSLVSKFSQLVKHKLRNQLNNEYLKGIVTDIVNALRIVSTNCIPQELCSLFLNGFLPEYDIWEQQLIALCEDVDFLLEGEHSSKVIKQLTGEESVNFIKFSLFSSMLIHQVLQMIRHRDGHHDQSYNSQLKDDSGLCLVNHTSKQLREKNDDENDADHATPRGNVDCDETEKQQNVSYDEKENSLLTGDISSNKGSEKSAQTSIQSTEESRVSEEVADKEQSYSSKMIGTEEQSLKQLLNISHLEEKILHIALTGAMCDVLREHFQSTSFYFNIQNHAEKLTEEFFALTELLESEKLLSQILTLALQKREDDRMWVKTAFLLDEERSEAVFKSVVCETNYTTSIKAFLKTAEKKSIVIPHDLLADFPSHSVTTLVLNHLRNSECFPSFLKINEPIAEWRELTHEELLHDCDVSLKECELVSVISKIKFLSACVNKCPALLEQPSWDFVLISAAYYGQNLKRTMHHFFPSKKKGDNVIGAQTMECVAVRNVTMFSIAVFELLDSLTTFCQRVQAKEISSEKTNFDETAAEWINVFAGDIQQVLLDIFISASASIDIQMLPSLFGCVFLDKFSALVMKIGFKMVFKQDPSQALKNKVLKASCSLIQSSVPTLQITAHNILKECIPFIVEADAFVVNNQIPAPEEDIFETSSFTVKPLVDAVQYTQCIVDTMLADISFGDSCVVQPHTDTYCYTTAYLLSWDLLLLTCEQASSELRYQYATLLRHHGFLQNLLNNLFRLMPSATLREDISKIKGPSYAYMFSDPPKPTDNNLCTSILLQHWACWMYYSVISRLPALVRQWWSDTKTKVSTIVQRVTVQFVTPTLCTRELQIVQKHNTKLRNMEVKVYPKAREVSALYTVEDARVELVITLPETYPLGTIQVDSHASLVGTSHWRSWVKQLTIFLTHQNGSLWDGLLLWKSNLDKRFEGVEECYICFSVIHGTNLQIPKLSCKTCRKKFHAPCLYKWFSTSNKSTCPICRNIF